MLSQGVAQDFVEAQQTRAAAASQTLQDFHSTTVQSVKAACEAALDRLQAYLETSGLGKAPAATTTAERGSDRHGVRGANEMLAAAAAGSASKEAEFHYTVQMQKRSEHQKLRKFIKVIELMVRNALHSIVLQSAQEVLSFLQRPRKVEDISHRRPYRRYRGARCWRRCRPRCRYTRKEGPGDF